MSIRFIIAPYMPDEWAKGEYSYTVSIGNFRISTEQYQKGLLNRWPQIDLHTSLDDKYDLEWKLPPSRPSFSGLSGSLSSSGQIITVGTGPKESFLDFVLWYRGFVVSEVALYLFGSGYEGVFELRTNTTEQDIVSYTGLID